MVFNSSATHRIVKQSGDRSVSALPGPCLCLVLLKPYQLGMLIAGNWPSVPLLPLSPSLTLHYFAYSHEPLLTIGPLFELRSPLLSVWTPGATTARKGGQKLADVARLLLSFITSMAPSNPSSDRLYACRYWHWFVKRQLQATRAPAKATFHSVTPQATWLAANILVLNQYRHGSLLMRVCEPASHNTVLCLIAARASLCPAQERGPASGTEQCRAAGLTYIDWPREGTRHDLDYHDIMKANTPYGVLEMDLISSPVLR
jgi:hypothetical protein